MLGLAPIAAAPIAGGGFSLTLVEEPISATISITFGGSADSGFYAPISANGDFSFGGSAVWNTLNAISSTVAIRFDGNANLTVAGRPIKITAMADSYIVRAEKYTYQTTALPDSLTVRGVPE